MTVKVETKVYAPVCVTNTKEAGQVKIEVTKTVSLTCDHFYILSPMVEYGTYFHVSIYATTINMVIRDLIDMSIIEVLNDDQDGCVDYTLTDIGKEVIRRTGAKHIREEAFKSNLDVKCN